MASTTMTRIEELDAIVAQFDLNLHPFYQDWRMGTLPTEKLTHYAAEYGAFVATIAAGWDTLGQSHYAQEEREHDAMWQVFRKELGSATEARNPETVALVNSANQLFGQQATAAGALYSFEAQQPKTSRSKLDGLLEHYNISEEGRKYFKVHADDFAEAEWIRAKIDSMSDAEFARTKTACAVMCSSMWSALDGVYYS